MDGSDESRSETVSRRGALKLGAAGAASLLLGAPGVLLPQVASAKGSNWSVSKAAKELGLKGVQLHAPFLRRPGYTAAEQMIPQFTELTGIHVTWDSMPYSDLYSKQVLSFRTQPSFYNPVLSDCVFVGSFVSNDWVVPLRHFWNDTRLADPNLDLYGPNGFFEKLLYGFGTWENTIYGLPFDCYSHLCFYNTKYLKEAGFVNAHGEAVPPQTWEQLRDTYGPKLTGKGRYAYALQAARNETIVADALMVFVQDWGGRLLNPATFKPEINTAVWRNAIDFMISLKKFMPPGSDTWDHDPTVQSLAQGETAIIDEWSPNYTTLSSPKTSKIYNELGVGVELGNGQTHIRKPAFGGFSLMVNKAATTKEQQAAYLFIQWITSVAQAGNYINHGGVSGRKSIYREAAMIKKYPYFKPLVESWALTNPLERPRFASWPAVSAVLADGASAAYTGSWSVNKALTYMQSNVFKILQTAGYYSGKIPKVM